MAGTRPSMLVCTFFLPTKVTRPDTEITRKENMFGTEAIHSDAVEKEPTSSTQRIVSPLWADVISCETVLKVVSSSSVDRFEWKNSLLSAAALAFIEGEACPTFRGGTFLILF